MDDDNTLPDEYFEDEDSYSSKPKRVRKSVQENTTEEDENYSGYSDQNDEDFDFADSRTSNLSDSRKQCKICGKDFAFLKELNKHMAEDHNQQAWQCKYCPSKYYADRKGLKGHMKTKHNEWRETVKCEFCPKTPNIMRTKVANAVHIGLRHSKGVLLFY